MRAKLPAEGLSAVATREDELLIELALKNHLLSQEEAAECLSASTGDVGAVLISKGYVKERHVKSLRKKVPKLLAERPTKAESTRAAPSDVAPIPSGIGSGSGSSPSQFAASDATFVAPAKATSRSPSTTKRPSPSRGPRSARSSSTTDA